MDSRSLQFSKLFLTFSILYRNDYTLIYELSPISIDLDH